MSPPVGQSASYTTATRESMRSPDDQCLLGLGPGYLRDICGTRPLDQCSGEEAGVPSSLYLCACRGPSVTPSSLYSISVVMEGYSARMLRYTVYRIRFGQREGRYLHDIPSMIFMIAHNSPYSGENTD